MKKIGYTYKKRVSDYQQRNETKCKRFQTNINKKRRLAYIDKSGVNNSSKDVYGYSKKEVVVFKREKAGQRITVTGAQKEG